MSAAEMQRRHSLLGEVAIAARVEALVVLGNEDDMSGYVRWFTDEPVSSYRTVCMFVPREGVTVIEHGGSGESRKHDADSDDYRGVVAIHTVAAFQSADYTAGYEAAVLVELIARRGFARIGLVGGSNMPHRFVRVLSEELAGKAELEDLTEAVDALMVVKSDEEQEHIRAAAALQDEVFAETIGNIRPGMREIDITAFARQASLRRGGGAGVILVGSAPQGSFAPFKPVGSQNRVIEAGDYVSLLIENAGPSGHFTEVARNIVLGKAGAQLREASEHSLALRHQILPRMKPGSSCGDIFAEHNAHRAAMGHPAENRIFAHGQGYNLVERPLVRWDEPMALSAGMNLAVHPTLADGATCFAVMCDNFLLVPNGDMNRLHRTEEKLFEV